LRSHCRAQLDIRDTALERGLWAPDFRELLTAQRRGHAE
jgi:hypothetical protein